VVLSLAAFASAASQRAGDPLLPLLAQAFGTTAGGASDVLTAFAVAYGGLQLVNGPLGDRIGKYRMVFWVTAISALGNLACALAPTLPLLVLARFASGATIGAIVPLAMAWIGDAIPYERRQTVLARFLIGNLTGGAITTFASGWLGERYGWQAIFYVMAALYVVAAAMLWLELRGNPATQQRRAAPNAAAILSADVRPAAQALGARGAGDRVPSRACSSTDRSPSRPITRNRNLGLGIAASGTLIAAFAGGGLLYAAIAGRLVPRLGERGLVLAGGICIGIGYLGLALAPGPGAAAAGLTVLGVGLYMLHNTLQVHATQMAPESRGAAVALFAFCLFSGQSTGVWLASHMVDAVGNASGFFGCGARLARVGGRFRRRLARMRAGGVK
jgi:MFS family permease